MQRDTGDAPGLPVVQRIAARVVVLDETGAVLLFEGRDSSRADAPRWWFTPGGGADPGESLHAAAARELFEETGLRAVIDGPAVFRRHAEFDFESTRFVQDEEFFVLRTVRFTPEAAGWNAEERRTLLGHRWWTADELAATDAIVYPAELAELVRAVVAGDR